ncbi:SpoIIE family protein phosphatase [Motilibacter deserti]|uniref:SpoIIE family protein phosphatase n=1 Tax=Motilibacter deserti TaxID=2714956 RepID=UPI002F2B3071
MTTYEPVYGPVDLTTCDREPIHIPGSIQPHGLLMAVDEATRTTVVVSENVRALAGIDAADVVGARPATVLGDTLSPVLRRRASAEDLMEPIRVRMPAGPGSLAGTEVDIVMHRSDGLVVVELEPADATSGVSAVSYRAARAAMTRLTETSSLPELCDALAREIRSLTGFDRVMVYRFDAEWNGEVVAEDKRDDLNAFLGLHYPATDIPVQARALYTVNWTRLIADVGYRPVPLVSSRSEPLDLSHAVLRSVSPIHIEYLTNMGVTASMSVSLLQDGQLWGLVACHHYSGPHRPSYDARSAAEFLGQTASRLIAERRRADDSVMAMIAQARLTHIASALARDTRAPLEALAHARELLLGLVEADGAALTTPDGLLLVGETPDVDAVAQIARILARHDPALASTDNVPSLHPDLERASERAAGALRVGLGPDEWVLFTRVQQERVVDWGGDPHNKALAAAEGPDVRLSPRKSFDKWREVVRGRSLPWERWQLDAADGLRTHIASAIVRRSREQIVMAEALQRAIILHEAPRFRGLEVAARYAPAQGGQLGGDWWDALRLADGRIALVVGDVAGHGVAAAAAMAQVRTALRAYLLDGHGPAAALDRLDNLVDALLDGEMATAVVAAVDPSAGTVELACAGHPPPVLAHPEGAHALDVPPRPPLGVGLLGRSAAVTVPLPPGAALVLYSDGLVERRDASVYDGVGRLCATASGGPGADLHGWADTLLAAGTGSEGDDTTLLVARAGFHL